MRFDSRACARNARYHEDASDGLIGCNLFLAALTDGCSSLRRLRMSRCPKMHTSVLAIAARARPDIWISKDHWEFGRPSGKRWAEWVDIYNLRRVVEVGSSQAKDNFEIGSPVSVAAHLP